MKAKDGFEKYHNCTLATKIQLTNSSISNSHDPWKSVIYRFWSISPGHRMWNSKSSVNMFLKLWFLFQCLNKLRCFLHKRLVDSLSLIIQETRR